MASSKGETYVGNPHHQKCSSPTLVRSYWCVTRLTGIHVIIDIPFKTFWTWSERRLSFVLLLFIQTRLFHRFIPFSQQISEFFQSFPTAAAAASNISIDRWWWRPSVITIKRPLSTRNLNSKETNKHSLFFLWQFKLTAAASQLKSTKGRRRKRKRKRKMLFYAFIDSSLNWNEFKCWYPIAECWNWLKRPSGLK